MMTPIFVGLPCGLFIVHKYLKFINKQNLQPVRFRKKQLAIHQTRIVHFLAPIDFMERISAPACAALRKGCKVFSYRQLLSTNASAMRGRAYAQSAERILKLKPF